eukprot:1159540-Pelagomonas_calceolata.AAC.1
MIHRARALTNTHPQASNAGSGLAQEANRRSQPHSPVAGMAAWAGCGSTARRGSTPPCARSSPRSTGKQALNVVEQRP